MALPGSTVRTTCKFRNEITIQRNQVTLKNCNQRVNLLAKCDQSRSNPKNNMRTGLVASEMLIMFTSPFLVGFAAATGHDGWLLTTCTGGTHDSPT